MTVERVLVSVALMLLSAMITWIYKDRNSIRRDEVKKAIEEHRKACLEITQALAQEQGKLDEMRNIRLERLETTAATKEDIAQLRQELKEFKDEMGKCLAELKRWIRTFYADKADKDTG